MAHKIKVSADTAEFKKELLALSREISRLGKTSKLGFLDKASREFMESGAKEALKEINAEYTKLHRNNLEILKTLRSEKLEQKQIAEYSDKFVQNQRKLVSLAKTRSEMEGVAPSALTRFGQGFGAFAGRIPGIGMLQRIGSTGGGAAGMMGAGVGMAGAAAIGFLASRGYAGYNEFNQNADSRISLIGRGHRDVYRTSAMANRMGLSAEQVRQLQLQSTDIFGTSRSSFDSMLGTAYTARSMGIDPSQLMSVGAGVRGGMGSKAAMEAQNKVNARLMATELDGVIGPWLETMTNLLSNINENGIGLDDAAIGILGTFANARSNMSPEMVAKTFGTLDNAVKGASGDRAAFFMSAFNNAGIGGGKLGGARLAMMQGLFGGDAAKLRARGNLSEKEIKDLIDQGVLFENGTKGFQKKAGGIVELFNKQTSKMGTTGKSFAAESLLGTGNPVVALEMMGLLQKASKGKLSATDEKRLKELGQTPQQRMEELSKDMANSLRVSQAGAADSRDMVGRTVADLVVESNNILSQIDQKISMISDIVGYFKSKFGQPGVPTALQDAVYKAKLDYTKRTGKTYRDPKPQ